ncbi:cysteine--tRNA ligase, partial [Glaciimonas sp. GG7]
KMLAGNLGFLARVPDDFLKGRHAGEHNVDGAAGMTEASIQSQIAARLVAKKTRDFSAADGIRAALLAEGVLLEDRPDGQTEWRRI